MAGSRLNSNQQKQPVESRGGEMPTSGGGQVRRGAVTPRCHTPLANSGLYSAPSKACKGHQRASRQAIVRGLP